MDRLGRSREIASSTRSHRDECPRLPARASRSTKLLLPALAAALFLALLAAPTATLAAAATSSTEPSPVAQETTTLSTTTGPTAAPSSTTSAASGQGVQPGQTAIVPPPAVQNPLNPGWKTDQMDVRVLPEYDQPAVLVIMSFSLPANVPLPATLKFPIPAGAQIAGIGEVDPNGNFTYNYASSYPPVTPGAEWDIATIQVKNYRQLQIDYYYDPGLPQGAGQRSFPLLAQMPMDVGTLLLHVQQPTGATNFQVQPALPGSGKASDGFTYSVATYPDVKAGSTLGHLVSYYKPDGTLSTGSGQSSPTQVNTNTVLLAAILVVVVCVGALVVYRMFFRSRRSGQKYDPKTGRPKAQRSHSATPRPPAAKRQPPAAKTPKATKPKPAATTKATATTDAATTADAAATSDTAAERSDKAVEYCVACGEELTSESPFCPNCGEARS